MKSLLTLLAILCTAASTCCNIREQAHGFVCKAKRHSPSGSCVAFSESFKTAATQPTHRRHHRKDYLTKQEYVHTVVCFLEERYWRCECHPSRKEVETALDFIYEMLHRNFIGLVVFTSHVVFGTGGLLRLQAGAERWASRGILQITGKENYEKLCQVTRSSLFCDNPCALATLHKVAVEASVRFWLCLIEKHFGCYESAKVTFWGTLRLLNPSEARCRECLECRARIQNREADYNALLAALMRAC